MFPIQIRVTGDKVAHKEKFVCKIRGNWEDFIDDLIQCFIEERIKIDGKNIVKGELVERELLFYTKEEDNAVTCYTYDFKLEFDMTLAVIRQETLRERNNG